MKKFKKILSKFAIPRTWVLTFLFLMMSCILIQRLFHLQIINGQKYTDNFSIMTTKTRDLKSTRGNIFDRNGNIIAYNKLSYSVILEDNGTYNSTREKNLSLNGDIYEIINIIEKNGDKIDTNFYVSIDEKGEYIYDVSGISLSRFKADVYGRAYIDQMKPEEAAASPQKMINDLTEDFGLTNKAKPYTDKELQEAGLPLSFSQEEMLKIISVRYALFTTSFRKYMPVTIATNVSENTVAEILERQSTLQGVDIQEDSIRVYDESVYFASIIGYTGKISAEELAEYKTNYPDADYSTTSIVGKSGIEKVMETQLQGRDGSETVYVDNLGKVLEIDDKSRIEPISGNDVYLTIDKELQIACYKILEQKIAGVVSKNIRNIKSFDADENTDASNIPIPIYDVYFALINNSVIDINHFTKADATDTEQKIYQVFVKLKNRKKYLKQLIKNLLVQSQFPMQS